MCCYQYGGYDQTDNVAYRVPVGEYKKMSDGSVRGLVELSALRQIYVASCDPASIRKYNSNTTVTSEIRSFSFFSW
jgi:hypothetical protein